MKVPPCSSQGASHLGRGGGEGGEGAQNLWVQAIFSRISFVMVRKTMSFQCIQQLSCWGILGVNQCGEFVGAWQFVDSMKGNVDGEVRGSSGSRQRENLESRHTK